MFVIACLVKLSSSDINRMPIIQEKVAQSDFSLSIMALMPLYMS